MAETVKQYLMRQRLSNYGYDWKDFRKMSAQKARMKSKLRHMEDRDIRRSLAKNRILGHGGRLYRTGGRVKYTVGQSFNEELLNMMKLGVTKGKRGYWA